MRFDQLPPLETQLPPYENIVLSIRAYPATSVANDLRTVQQRIVCAYEWPNVFRQRYAQALRTRSARIESTCIFLSADLSVWETEKVTLLGCRPPN